MTVCVDALWTIGDSLGMKNSSGILVVIKFEKANDSVAHDFLFKVSEKIKLWIVFQAVDKNLLYRYIKLCYE